MLIKRITRYDDGTAFLKQPKLPWYALSIALFLSLPVLSNGLQMDDLIHWELVTLNTIVPPPQDLSLFGMFSFFDGDPERTTSMIDHGLAPWWTYPEMRHSFWRPMAELTHWIDFRLWPGCPVLMNLQNILWYGAVVFVVSVLFRRVMGPSSIAGLASLLYAVSNIHSRVFIMVGTRSSLMATFFGVLTLLVLHETSRGRLKSGAAIGPACLLLSLLSAEYGLVTLAYLFAHSLFMDERRPTQRIWSLSSHVLVAACWMAIYRMSGFGVFGTELYLDPLRQPFLFVESVARNFPALFAGQWLSSTPEILVFPMLSASTIAALRLGTVVFLFVMAVLLYPLLRRDRAARFWSLGFALSLVLMCTSHADSRLLILAGLGAAPLMARFLDAVHHRAAWLPGSRLWRRTARAFFYVLILMNVILSLPSFPIGATSFPRYLEPRLNRPAVELPADSVFTGQDVVLVNFPNPLWASYIPHVRQASGLPQPAHAWILGDGLNAMEVTRRDERTLEIHQHAGFISSLYGDYYRSSSFPMSIGQRIEMSGMTAEVLSLTEDQRPLRVSFRFSRRLEDDSLKFLQWEAAALVPFEIPDVGETVRFPAVPFY